MAFSFGGQASSAQTGFSFGSTPAATSSLFGSSTGFSFGGVNTASSSSSFANPFGQSASSVSSIFGASSASLFGGSSAAASTPSLFGGSSTAFSFSSPSLFGASSQPASTASLFGGSSTPSFGIFGQQTSQPSSTQSQLVPSAFPTGVVQQPDFSALKELEAINNACEPNSPQCRFTYLFLNIVDNPAARVKPPNIDELQWRVALQRAGGPNNPDRLWPVQAKGFKDLIARKAAQEKALQEYSTRLEAAEQASRHMARKQETLLRERIDTVRKRHLELGHMLLRIMRHIDALEGRFAGSQGQWDPQAQQTAHQLGQNLKSLANAIASDSAGGLQRKIEALATAAKLREGCPAAMNDIPRLDDGSLAELFSILTQQANAIASLQDVLRRIARDVAILEKPTPQT